MTKEVLEKANELVNDIDNIDIVLKEREKRHWVRVICPADKEPFYSIRFQEELSKWLAQKKEEYQKELEEL